MTVPRPAPAAQSGPGVRRARTALLLAALAALAGVALLTLLATPKGHSYLHNMTWLTAFEAALSPANPYPRHLPALWLGLGGLDFFFYGPLPFWLAAGPARWICWGCTPQVVFGLAGGLLWVASGLAMWPLARRFLAPWPALAAALAYALMPYHLGIDWVVRQAVGEFAAYVFVPLVAFGIVTAMEDRRTGPALPLGFAGLVLSHLPTALLAAHIFGVVVLVWALAHPRAAAPALPRIAAMSAAGLALAGFYWLPAIVLLGDVSPQLLSVGLLRPSEHYLFGPGSQVRNLFEAAILSAMLAALVAAMLAVAVAPRAERGPRALWMLLPAVLAVALNSGFAAPLWETWIIGKVQFPFRLAVFSDLAGGLAAGALVAALLPLRDAGRRLRGLCAAGLGALILAGVICLPLQATPIWRGLKNRAAPVMTLGAPEYLPPGFVRALADGPVVDDREIFEIKTRVADLVTAMEAPDSEVLPVTAVPRRWTASPEKAGPVVLALPYWKHMTAVTGAGVPLPLAADPSTGLVALDVPGGTERIVVRLPWHWSERLGLALTVAGLAGTAALSWPRRRRRAGPDSGMPP